MIEYKWCLIEIENMLSATGWNIVKRIEPQLKGHIFRKWELEKDEHPLTLEFFHQRPTNYPISYTSDLITYACNIQGTDISLGFLEYHQKDAWMKALQTFSEMLNNNYNLAQFGGHAIKSMNVYEAIKIAQDYIDEQQSMNAKITGASWNSGWIDGHNIIENQVWIVSADNLTQSSFIDGNNVFSIVVSWDTWKVEDVRVS